QFLIESNIISHASVYGIRIDAAARTPGTNAPHPGVARNLPTINHDRLVPGAVIVNNIVASSGQAGIVFSGDPNNGNVPNAVVPYGRIINNTIYGGDVAGGTGVQVTENAAPTLLNNLFSNLDIGVEVDGTSQNLTVVGFSAHYNVASPVSGTIENDGMVLTSDPFVDASTENFYLTELTPAIDSAIDILQDRNDFVVVKNAVGLPPSPIIAPSRDLYGQLRADDPAIAGSVPGIGLNVFKDRGAVDRVDFTQPTIALAVPLDNSPLDQEKLQPNMVRLERSAARGLSRMVLQLNDIGVGIDKATVDNSAFRITYSPYPGADASLQRVLVEGADYLYRYLESSNQVVFESAAVYPLGTYRIDVTSREAGFFLPALLTDLAGRPLLPNANDGSISFTISLSDKPSMPQVSGSADEGRVDLDWTAAANGLAITAYEVEQSHNDGDWTSVTLADPTQTSVTVSGLNDGESYRYRVRATNNLGTSDWGQAGPFTPLQVPMLALANDTGPYSDDGITNNGLVDVSNLLTGADWEYSTNSGITWRTGTGTSFTLLPRTYAAGSVQVRQTLGGATSSPGTNAIDLVVDVTPPFAPSITAVDDNAGLIGGIVRNGSITDDATPTLYGTAEGDSEVTIYDGNDVLGTTWADAAGIWSFTPATDLENRSYAFAALARDLAGNEGPQSPLYTVTVDTQAPEVSIDAVNDDLDPFTGRVDNGGRTNDQTLTLVGRSTPSTTVIIKNGTTEIGRAVTNTQGDWRLETRSLAAGAYDFVASVTDSLGRTGMSAAYSVTIDRTPPATPVITTITDNVGSVQGAIANGATTDDTTPTISGTAEPNAYISIFITLPDGTARIEGGVGLRANASGNWSYTPAALANGTYSFKVIATDAAGNSSAFSAIRTLTVASGTVTPPVTPGVLAITGVVDNAGSVQGDVPHNGLTDDTTLEITGTAAAAAVVEIRDGATLLGSVVASANGTWSYTTKPLAAGLHSLTATVGGDTTPARNVTVQVDASTGLDLAATGVWGPDPAEGYRTVLIDFNQPVTGVTVDAFMIEHRGRKILVQGATVTGGGMNYVLKLPDRFRNLTGGFTITLFSTDIESLLNPGSRMRNPSYFNLPDPGVNNNPG
ncbi:MAG: fibronectin type III domain-containing protein, partial [Pirellulales bacterium]|nr:fibronectin type III domain-containing protein [Pirellulales bacterium]